MRIALYGNVCNNHYQIAKALRGTGEIDAHIYVDSVTDPQQLPESDDPWLAGNYPDWIHRDKHVTASVLSAPWTSPLLPELERADVVIVSGNGPIFAPFTTKPMAFLVSGGDLTIAPFPIRFRFLYRTPKQIGRALLVGIWQRRGLRRVAEIWSQPFAPFRQALQQLRVPAERIAPVYFPVMMDLDRMVLDERVRERDDPAVRALTERFDFFVFHPSRLMIRDSAPLRATGQWKRNDALIEGFAQFLAISGERRAALVMPDRTASPDVQIARQIARRLSIESNVVWLKPPRPEGFTREELGLYYSLADVVADDFGAGWFGSVVLEGMAYKRPVLCYVDELAMRQLYPRHPIVSVRTPAEIAKSLLRLYHDPNERATIGRVGRRWVAEFHSNRNATARYLSQIREFANRARTGERLASAPAYQA